MGCPFFNWARSRSTTSLRVYGFPFPVQGFGMALIGWVRVFIDVGRFRFEARMLGRHSTKINFGNGPKEEDEEEWKLHPRTGFTSCWRIESDVRTSLDGRTRR
jgi:hypothetical protein